MGVGLVYESFNSGLGQVYSELWTDPTNDNMYDESIQRALRRHKIRPITLAAPLRDELVSVFTGEHPMSHIITGTAGDGNA